MQRAVGSNQEKRQQDKGAQTTAKEQSAESKAQSEKTTTDNRTTDYSVLGTIETAGSKQVAVKTVLSFQCREKS